MVSGTVVELHADFNDCVKKGQVLLKLDPIIFNAAKAGPSAMIVACALATAAGVFFGVLSSKKGVELVAGGLFAA